VDDEIPSGGHHEHGNGLQSRTPVYSVQDRGAIDDGHHKVQQNDPGTADAQDVERLASVRHRHHDEPVVVEQFGQGLSQVGVIFDEEHPVPRALELLSDWTASLIGFGDYRWLDRRLP
jgi:hypothetical protein